MISKRNIIIFILITFIISYFSWVISIIIAYTEPTSVLITIFHLIGGSGPLIGTIVFIFITKNKKEYFKKLFRFKGIKWSIWLITFSPLFILTIVTILYYGKLSIDPEFIKLGIFYAIGLLFFGPIPEEVGWRGVLFDELSKSSFLKAQMITAFIWFVWHLPLFFIVGSYQNQMGIASVEFVIWGGTLIVQSFIMGYLYLVSNRSILVIIIFHYLVNLSGELYLRDSIKDILLLLIYIILLLIIFVFYKKSSYKYINHI